MKSIEQLGTDIPSSKVLCLRNLKKTTLEQRQRALKETEYLMFSFPADLLILDYLSDSGTTAMTDLQWASLFHGDESYGRNRGYYALLDAIRDVFERGDEPGNRVNLILSGETDVDKLMNELYLNPVEGGFANGGPAQLQRPNAFLTPQGRAAEYLLFSTLKDTLVRMHGQRKQYFIPNNGHFDTTGANIRAAGIEPVNLFENTILDPFPAADLESRNPFKGNMDTGRLEALIRDKGAEAVPVIYLTITNNTAAGQPVSMANIKETCKISRKYGIPLLFDAARFAENAWFIKCFEPGFAARSVRSIVQEMFSHADGFTISFKKDGLSNIGGGLFLKDQGLFQARFSPDGDIGLKLKERQILTFGNDSYGGLSGRDIMALALGLREVMNEDYLYRRTAQAGYLARGFVDNSVPVVLPPGGHAVYIDTERFFQGTAMKTEDFGGLGFTVELVKHYGIRACELGAFAFEWDQRNEEQRKGILNLIRFAIPRNAYGREHLDYTIAAVAELYRNRDIIPKMRITRGAQLRLRHFQAALEPVYG